MKVHCNACGHVAEQETAACPRCGTVETAPRRNRLTAGALGFGVAAATVQMGVLLWVMYCRK